MQDVDMTADDKVRAWVLRLFREDEPRTHQATCPDAQVTFVEGRDSVYGDTGCEYARLEATIACPHADPVTYVYGQFGQLAGMLEDIGGQ